MKRVIDKGADKAVWMHRLVCTSVDQQQTQVHIFMLSINIKLPFKPHTVLVHQYDEELLAPAARSINPLDQSNLPSNLIQQILGSQLNICKG